MFKNLHIKILITFSIILINHCLYTNAGIFDSWFRVTTTDNNEKRNNDVIDLTARNNDVIVSTTDNNDVIDFKTTDNDDVIDSTIIKTTVKPPESSDDYGFSWGNLWNSITSSISYCYNLMIDWIKDVISPKETTLSTTGALEGLKNDALTSTMKPHMESTTTKNDLTTSNTNKPIVITTTTTGIASIHTMSGIAQQMHELASPSIDAARKAYLFAELETKMNQQQNVDHFVKSNGLSMIKQALRASDDRIREKAAILLGTLCENNTHVKKSAYDQGLLDLIMDSYSLEGRRAVRRIYLQTITCLIREYPMAQKKFVDLGGVQLLVKILTDRSYHKQCLQAARLVNRLLREKWRIQEEIAKIGTNQTMELNREKLQQYERIGLVESLQATDKQFCKRLVEFSRDVHETNLPSHETILRTLKVSIHFRACDRKDVAVIQQNLMDLKNILAEKSITDPYYNDILALCQDVLEFMKQEDNVDDEHDDVIRNSTSVNGGSTIPPPHTVKVKPLEENTEDIVVDIEKLPIKSNSASKINACARLFVYFSMLYTISSIFYF